MSLDGTSDLKVCDCRLTGLNAETLQMASKMNEAQCSALEGQRSRSRLTVPVYNICNIQYYLKMKYFRHQGVFLLLFWGFFLTHVWSSESFTHVYQTFSFILTVFGDICRQILPVETEFIAVFNNNPMSRPSVWLPAVSLPRSGRRLGGRFRSRAAAPSSGH